MVHFEPHMVAKVIRSLTITLITVPTFVLFVGQLKGYVTPKKRMFMLYLLVGTVVAELTEILHELGHALAAWKFGLHVIFGGNLDYYITTIPTITELPAEMKMIVALGGPLVSGVLVVLLLFVSNLFQKEMWKLLFRYIALMTVLGGVGTLFIPVTGDCINFAQGFSEHFGVPLPLIFTVALGMCAITIAALLVLFFRTMGKL